jgi:hypothetical protein
MRCQRWSRILHRQDLAIAASLAMSRALPRTPTRRPAAIRGQVSARYVSAHAGHALARQLPHALSSTPSGPCSVVAAAGTVKVPASREEPFDAGVDDMPPPDSQTPRRRNARALIRCRSGAAVRVGQLGRRAPGRVGRPHPQRPPFQPGFDDADTSITAAIGLNGWYGGYYGQEDASSAPAHVRPDAPPFFIAHGDHDTVAPVEVARYFAGRLAGVSTNPVVYAELPGAQHAFDLFGSLRFELVVDAIEAFTAWVRSSTARPDHDLRPEY